MVGAHRSTGNPTLLCCHYLAMDGPSDRELVRRGRDGDRGALGALFARHRALLRILCLRALGDPGLAEDAAQEACLQAMVSLDRLRDPDRFGSWLCGIGLNICRQRLRDRSRQSWSWEAIHGGRSADGIPEWGDSLEELAEIADVADRVRRAVDALPRGQREAVTLFYLAGFTRAEISAVLGVREGAVRTRLNKARARLREELWSLWKEDDVAVRENMDFVEMRVAEVRRSPQMGETRERSVVLLEEVGGPERMAIWIGPFEATGISFLLEKAEMPRPMTIQFVGKVLSAAGGRLTEVRINRLQEGTFYAEAVIETAAGGDAIVDARPSDAIALSLLTEAPIAVAREVLDALKADGKGDWHDFEAEQEKYVERSPDIVSAARSEWEVAIAQLRDRP
jgi:RNA polymerase sigma factor (sigma-70 family)